MKMTINEIPQPSSLQEVEQMIQALYDPRSSPDDVRNINRVLQGLQTSQNGWALSHQLSASMNEHTQFFAALSFIVKLNTDWTSLSPDDAQQLLHTLIDWLIRAIQARVKSYIWKKLCLTLVTFYIHFSPIWPSCIRHLLCSITNHATVPVEATASFPKSEEILSAASPEEQEVILYFTKSLVEEVMKLDPKVLQNQHFEQSLEDNVNDTVVLIASILNLGGKLGQNSDISYGFEPDEKHQTVLEESLSCYQAWASFSARTNLQTGSKFLEFRRLSIMIMRWMKHPKLFTWSTTVITEILTGSPKFFSQDDLVYLASLITSDWGLEKLSQIVGLEHEDYDPAENSVFPQLAIAFAEANVDHIAKAPTNHTSATIFDMLHTLLKLPGSPVADEDISSLEFEFWSSLIEMLTEQSTGPDHSSWWMLTCKQHVFQAIEEFWSKIHIPLPSVLAEWSKDDKEGFQSFRKDVADLLETAYPLLHCELFEKLVSHVLMQVNIEEPNWRDIEASLFCINSISDSMTSDPQEYQSLSMLLSSSLFTKLAAPETNSFLRTRLSGIALIGQYSPFFEQNPRFLAPALNFLFSSLTIPQLVSQASRSIFLLCSSCRKELVPELFTFIGQYEAFASTHNHDTTARERVVGAIGCIVQVLPSEELKLKALEPVLTTIFRDLDKCKALITINQAEEAKLAAVSVLKCLVSLGKALQAPDDLPIVLDDDSTSSEAFWKAGKGLEIQTTIAQTVKDLAVTLSGEIEVVDTACCVFRSGFSETSPGLLVFQAPVVTDFLVSLIGICSFHDAVLGTASAFICSHSSSGSHNIEHEANQLKHRILQATGNFRNEPDVAQNVLEFFNRLVPKYLNVLFESSIDIIFVLALDGLVSKEQFTKKAAATFWTSIINAIAQDDKYRQQIQNSIAAIGPSLARNLVASIGGDAARSELDWLTELLKKLVFRIPISKSWLESALFTEDDFPSVKISRAEKQMFIKQLFMLRGGRGTNQLVKEFWMKCRGINFDYVS